MKIRPRRRRWYSAMLATHIKDFARSVPLALICIACPPAAEPIIAKEASTATQSARVPDAGTISFILDAQRILMNVTFETPEGGTRNVLTWFNMGMPAPVLTKALYHELGIDRGHPLTMKLGEFSFEAAPETVVDGDGGLANPEFAQRFVPHPVEAMLPAAFFQQAIVTLDYQRRTLTLARPETRKPEGIAVPFAINTKTGLIAPDAEVDGKRYPIVIDAGSGYSWIRGRVLAEWLAKHPDWRRADGAVGLSNYNMLDLPFEKDALLARVPELPIGAITLENVGLLGIGFVMGNIGNSLIGEMFWNNWQQSAPSPVIGWLGGNALKPFKLTIDFPNRVSYWQRQTKADAHDLDQVAITLVRRSGSYFIGGFVRKANPAQSESVTLEGCEIGDELVAVEGLSAWGASIEQVLSAPGARRLRTH